MVGIRFAGLVSGLLLFLALGAQSEGLPAAERASLLASGKVSKALLDRMPGRGQGRVSVLISFHRPAAAAPALHDGSAHRSATTSRGDAILGTLSRGEFQIGRRYRTLPILAGEIDAAGLARLANNPLIRFIEPQLGGRGATAQSVPLTEIDTAKNLGVSGQGVRVAILDTGVDKNHADLSGVVVEERCWCSGGGGCCPGNVVTAMGPGSADDDHGHGTHIAGIIASNGSIAPPGAAADVEVVSLKVLDSNNLFSLDQDVLDALDWLNAESINQGSAYVDIVNMSLETTFLYGRPCNDPNGEVTMSPAWTAAVTQLTARGILVVAASGNQGVGLAAPAPACVEESFSVAGSYDAEIPGGMFWLVNGGTCTDNPTSADLWACGSNAYNNTITGAKTDLVAPGAEITSSAPGGGMATRSGTSQAAAHVSGCAALVMEANASDPTRTLADLENDLQTTDVLIPSTRAAFGSNFPRLNCAMAVPEPEHSFQSLALLFGLVAAARLAAPSRQRSRCDSRCANTSPSA